MEHVLCTLCAMPDCLPSMYVVYQEEFISTRMLRTHRRFSFWPSLVLSSSVHMGVCRRGWGRKKGDTDYTPHPTPHQEKKKRSESASARVLLDMSIAFPTWKMSCSASYCDYLLQPDGIPGPMQWSLFLSSPGSFTVAVTDDSQARRAHLTVCLGLASIMFLDASSLSTHALSLFFASTPTLVIVTTRPVIFFPLEQHVRPGLRRAHLAPHGWGSHHILLRHTLR